MRDYYTEAIHESIDDALEDEFLETTREGQVLSRLRKHGELSGLLARISDKLEEQLTEFQEDEENRNDVGSALADEAEYNQDPYGYYGLSRNDF